MIEPIFVLPLLLSTSFRDADDIVLSLLDMNVIYIFDCAPSFGFCTRGNADCRSSGVAISELLVEDHAVAAVWCLVFAASFLLC